MDLNETYSWLNRSRKYDSEIRRLKAKADELKNCLLSSGIDYSKERVNSSPDDAMSKIFAEIDETEQMIREKSLERGCVISEISDTIETLDSELEKTVLTEFFISKKSISKIGKELSYDRSWVNKQKKEGIKKICSIIVTDAEET